jgi:hypothetical protein
MDFNIVTKFLIIFIVYLFASFVIEVWFPFTTVFGRAFFYFFLILFALAIAWTTEKKDER